MDKSDLILRLKQIYPLVFELPDGCYCIGVDQCRKCTTSEETSYQAVFREFRKLKEKIRICLAYENVKLNHYWRNTIH